jgi:hypothetical protein
VEVLDKGGAGLVGLLALAGDFLRKIAVLIPTAMEELDKPYAALG